MSIPEVDSRNRLIAFLQGALTQLNSLIVGNGDSTANEQTLIKFNTSRAWEFQATGSAGASQHLELKNVVGNSKNFRIVTDGYCTFKNQDGTNTGAIHCETGNAQFDGTLTLGEPGDTSYIKDGSGTNRIAFADAGNLALYDTNGNNEFLVANGYVYCYGYLTVETAGTTIAQNSWTAPTLAGTWSNYGGDYQDAGYLKDSLGFIHLRGLLLAGGAGDTIFTLPAGYRPSAKLIFSVQVSDGGSYVHGRVDVDTDGTVDLKVPATVASGDWVSLDGINFDTQS